MITPQKFISEKDEKEYQDSLLNEFYRGADNRNQKVKRCFSYMNRAEPGFINRNPNITLEKLEEQCLYHLIIVDQLTR